MKIRNYIIIFCFIVFTISFTFVTSCSDKDSNKKTESTASETTAGESGTSSSAVSQGDAPTGSGYKNLVDGKYISFEDFKGHVLVVDFWATWCQPCRTEIPWFMELYDKYKSKKLTIIGVSVDRGGEAVVKSFIEKQKINYPIIMATPKLQREFEEAMGQQPIRSIPTTIFKNKEGDIVKVHVGIPRDPDPKALFEQEIKELLGDI